MNSSNSSLLNTIIGVQIVSLLYKPTHRVPFCGSYSFLSLFRSFKLRPLSLFFSSLFPLSTSDRTICWKETVSKVHPSFTIQPLTLCPHLKKVPEEREPKLSHMSEETGETSPPPPPPPPAMSAFGQIAAPNQANNSLSPSAAAQQLAEYQHRMQLYEFAAQAAVRFRLNQLGAVSGASMVHPALEAASSFGFDPRFRFLHEEPKPQHSYIGLIAMAILSSAEKKMVLSDIYQHILDHYPYFRNRGPGWRNSIRHNLSLNDCFVKAGRSANGKGHYWAIHPANIDDFTKGDFRRRKAQRKVRKHMGLSVPDDEDSSSPTPTPTPALNPNLPPFIPSNPHLLQGHHFGLTSLRPPELHFPFESTQVRHPSQILASLGGHFTSERSGRRLFDVESLLAPDSTVNDDGKRNERKRAETSSPARSTESPVGLVRAESNCSSPSISSTEVTTPPPSVSDPISSIPGLSTWQMHMQQLNATFFNQSRNGVGLNGGHPLNSSNHSNGHNSNNLNPNHFPHHFSPAVSWAAAAAAFPQSAVSLYTSLAASSASSSSSASSASSAASGHNLLHIPNHHHNHHPIHHLHPK